MSDPFNRPTFHPDDDPDALRSAHCTALARIVTDLGDHAAAVLASQEVGLPELLAAVAERLKERGRVQQDRDARARCARAANFAGYAADLISG